MLVFNKPAVVIWEKGIAIKQACAHPDCTDEGIFAIEDGEHLCMQHIHERIPWLPTSPSRGAASLTPDTITGRNGKSYWAKG
jgi:hypothetical protein